MFNYGKAEVGDDGGTSDTSEKKAWQIKTNKQKQRKTVSFESWKERERGERERERVVRVRHENLR